MSKSVFIFTILVVFVVIAVWFVVQKNKNSEDLIEVPSPTATPAATPISEGGQPFDPAQGKPVRYDNGLIVQDIIVGNGKVAANGDTLAAHYIGTLENGTKFDSSYDRGQPLEFVLGAGQLIQGWEFGLVGMKEGGKRKLVVPASLGYGAKGAGGVIPPNATLVFEIELVSVKKP